MLKLRISILIALYFFNLNAFGSKLEIAKNQISAGKKSQILSFNDWKNLKINETKGRLSAKEREMQQFIKVRGRALSSDKMKTQADLDEMNKIESQLRNEELSFELAKDLTINDYFVGYIVKNKNLSNEELKEIVKKMSSEDLVEILSAFSKTVQLHSESNILPISSQFDPAQSEH